MAASNFSEMEFTIEEFNEILKNETLVIADFYAEWCMPCLMLAPVFEELAENIKNAKFVKINTEDNEELAGKHKVSSIPCIIIFKNGKEVERITGVRPAEHIEGKIREHL